MKSSILAVLGGASTALAAVRGFNYAAQEQTYDTFVSQFKTAASLSGASDFTSARLYTMIQDGTTDTPIDAIQAAIDTNTTLLLGLWASEDQASFDNELTALKSAISTYGSSFADLVVGISVGSEDLYRISPTGIAADSGAGQSPDTLVDYIGQVRSAISGTSLSSSPVGHVDTWNVYVNSSNSEVISNCDFLGLDEYPYYQTTDVNTIGNSSFLFFQAYEKVAAVAGGKPIWVTESGWPVSGPTSNDAVPSTADAETYWQGVACALENRGINFWWYILADSGSSPSFGVSSNGTPLYDLACNSTAGYTSTTASSSSASATGTASKNSSSATGSSSASATASNVTASGAAGVGSQAATSGASASGSATATGSAAAGASTASASTGGDTTATATGTETTATGSSGASAATFTGAASKAEGSMAGLAIGALVAALVL
ncbi:GPI-anchored cell wall beta-1,3-endoglucanase EglC [Exophiala viscosa]|uniref:Probable glucan endo-1,3-beta-glucosidase eglC n=1 Tax=Exophiala viscosa TaxID=2486360 RepID=A0AAN6E8E0_9EURO|nr:GPI-anchored cell wall beta-1,3-endoglucanase EglC [Exophiala viscosa]